MKNTRKNNGRVEEQEARWLKLEVIVVGTPGAAGIQAVSDSMERNLTPLIQPENTKAALRSNIARTVPAELVQDTVAGS